MKYIKSFNESISNHIKEDIRDILLSLYDLINRGADASLEDITLTDFININDINLGPNSLKIEIGYRYFDHNMFKFKPSEFKDEFLRLNDYLDGEGHVFSSFAYNRDLDVIYPRVNGVKKSEMFDYMLSEFKKPINYLVIYYKKKY